MIKIGMMIGDRYEILEKIGTGGMSDVYKAKDHKLNRFVAVKVLKQEFSENANFVSKFRIEAQAAAGLMHPNIVNVYDVGEESGIYYIVMELVEGITLKKYIEKKARLSYKEAVTIAIQVSMGIDAAHKNHIIHRDIKPQNIIISRDGKVKVTDFGIAKAATSNTITSNVMGSVHYTSPEQARGGYSDEKSDIYSLGVTLFEMLTGRVPFNGETTVAIAIKHIQEEMPSPREYVAEIPISVEDIVLKCCQKSPDRRYQSMQELIADLKQSLISPDEDFVVQTDPDIEGGTRTVSEEEMAEIKRGTAYQDARDYQEYDSMRLRAEVEAEYEDDADMVDDEADYDYDPRMEHLTTALAVIAGIVICVIIIIGAVNIFKNMNKDGEGSQGHILSEELSQEEVKETEEQDEANQDNTITVDMPDVIGINVDDAQRKLAELGLYADVVYENSDTIDEGVVMSTSVVAGTNVSEGTAVTLTVSAGASGVKVPELSGKNYEDANSQLLELGFLVNRTESYSETISAGIVVSQTPSAGTMAPKGSVITVNVSLGKEEKKVRVPNLIGLTEADGTIVAAEEGLQIGDVGHVYNDEVSEGLICYQSYSYGSYVEPETTVDIKVSMGPQKNKYKCNINIDAPTLEEAPDYVSGSEVSISLVTDNGDVLLEKKTSSFPETANYYGLTSSGGTITMTYTVQIAGETTTDPETGETVTAPGTTEQKSFTRRVEFVEE
ncbi:MAG: Stk1 family PASTA domain-containing Ser/Thr kinase [Lachnospiraceae bacterium]|nr:Stk1 family PASTA domain-containing Ser/Thr kinase [Lachnospiraceae bacterium]